MKNSALTTCILLAFGLVSIAPVSAQWSPATDTAGADLTFIGTGTAPALNVNSGGVKTIILNSGATATGGGVRVIRLGSGNAIVTLNGNLIATAGIGLQDNTVGGNDTVTVGTTGVVTATGDAIQLNEGNDVVLIQGQVSSTGGNAIAVGNGADTVTVAQGAVVSTSATANAINTAGGDDVVTISGRVMATSAGGGDGINTGAGSDTVVVNSTGVVTSAFANAISTGSENDSITIMAGAYIGSSCTVGTITAGTGDDVIVIGGTVVEDNTGGGDAVAAGAGNNTITIQGTAIITAAGGNAISALGGNDTLTVAYGARISSAGGSAAIGLAGGNDTFTNYGSISATGAADAINMGTGDDIFSNVGGTISAITGQDAISLGGGNDTATISSWSRITGNINGGAQTDTLKFNFTGVNASTASILKALTAASGSLTIRGQTFTWSNMENLEITTSSYEAQAQTPNQKIIGSLLDNLSAMPTEDMRIALSELDNSGNIPAALDQLTPSPYSILSKVGFTTANILSMNVDNRLSDIRAGNAGMNNGRLTMIDPFLNSTLGIPLNQLSAYNGTKIRSSNPDLKPGTMSDSPSGNLTAFHPARERKWGTFASANVLVGDQNATSFNPQQDFTMSGMTLGADYQVNQNLAVGAMFGYQTASVDMDNNGSSSEIDSYMPGVYATYYKDRYYINGMFAYGLNTYSNERRITFGAINRKAGSNMDGDQFMGNISGGYDFTVSEWTVGPVLGLQVVHQNIDAFSETDAGALSLNVAEQEADSVRSKLGGRLTRVFQIKSFSLRPEVRMFWQHEFMDDSRGISARFNDSTIGSSFAVTTGDPERDSALLGLGLSGSWDDFIMLFVNYDSEIREDYLVHNMTGGLKVCF